MRHSEPRVIISGGGTGGHIYPAVSIAQEIKLNYPHAEILFIGALGKMEMEKVPKAGFSIEGLWISGLQRKWTISNIMFPLKVLVSLIKSHQIISRFKPDLAIGVGGFASGPLLYAAAQRGIPTLIHEQNSYAGITNKWLSGKVNKICVAYDGMDKFFPKSKIIKTGNPVRNDILNLTGKREAAFQHFGLNPDLKTILVIGGSLGAKTINEAIACHLEEFVASEIQIIWQTGKLYFSQYGALENSIIKVREFIYEMDLAYAAADLVISRAGASSVSEIALAYKPAILIPSPNVAEDHQTKNARALTDRNAAVYLADKQASKEIYIKTMELLQDEKLCQELKSNLKPFAIADARARIFEEIQSLLKK